MYEEVVVNPDFWVVYLKLLGKSIEVDYARTPQAFCTSKGFGIPRNGNSWESRSGRWYYNNNTIGYDVDTKQIVSISSQIKYNRTIPLFGSMVEKALKDLKTITNNHVDKPTTTKKEKTMLDNMKVTSTNVLDTNKEAIKLAAKLGVGKTANTFFLNKLVGKLPWYAKWAGAKKHSTTNPLAKVVAANTANLLVQQFAPNNKKLKYIADGMVQEAIVDISLNSDMLERMIGELETICTLPDFEDK